MDARLATGERNCPRRHEIDRDCAKRAVWEALHNLPPICCPLHFVAPVMTFNDILLQELWENTILPHFSLCEVATLTRTSHELRSVCYDFLARVSPTQLRALVERLPVRQVSDGGYRAIHNEQYRTPRLGLIPEWGIFEVSLFFLEHWPLLPDGNAPLHGSICMVRSGHKGQYSAQWCRTGGSPLLPLA